jgi:hypothetical protein
MTRRSLGTQLILVIAIACLLQSCARNDLEGKTYYLLDGRVDANYYASLKEIELTFLSDSNVETSLTLYADAMGYRVYTDTSSFRESKITEYKYENGILELPSFNMVCRLEFQDDNNIKTNEGEILYIQSIVTLLGTQEAIDRISHDPKGNEINIIKKFLSKPYKPLLKRRLIN